VRRLAGEVTRLNYEGQFKPFVYLNVTGTGADLSHGPERSRHGRKNRQEESSRKIPPRGGIFLLSLGSN
jgi:hypothetical protein